MTNISKTNREVETKTVAGKKPASGWRNRWFIPVAARDRFSDAMICGPTEIFASRIWPSRDAAETSASKDLRKNENRPPEVRPIYLGAFPIDESQ